MKTLLKIAGHLLPCLLAFLIVQAMRGGGVASWAAISGNQPADLQAVSHKGTRSAPKDTASKARMKGDEYEAAWAAISGMNWTRAQRFAYQSKLLGEWAEVDLEGALKAALAESWRDGSLRVGGESFPFRNAFASVFVDRSEDVWKMIQSHSVGVLETSILLDAWSTTLISAEPDAFLGYLREMDQSETLTALEPVWRSGKDSGFHSKILDILARKLADGMSLEELDSPFFSNVGKAFTQDQLLERISRSPDGALFETKILAGCFAETLGGKSSGEIAAVLDSLPSDLRGPLAKSLLTANSMDKELLQTALDTMVASGNWALFVDSETARAMRAIQRTADPVDLAEWSLALPPRQETSEIFHRGVEPYIRKNPEGAWNWIQSMDDGYWKDRALAEYSQINLHVYNDPEKSAAALEQIRDAGFRGRAEGWRKDWERQKGR